jgi:hypothetical protein
MPLLLPALFSLMEQCSHRLNNAHTSIREYNHNQDRHFYRRIYDSTSLLSFALLPPLEKAAIHMAQANGTFGKIFRSNYQIDILSHKNLLSRKIRVNPSKPKTYQERCF